ncbi:aldose 1-epimerase [Jeotgalibacillus soli]|uniref:Epimerase n=1 Tax=Jeotgalibacillus soli TaxID=889306 RepID=A0A0C2VK31_9BACL|nr:aldose 1-epimerase [Jeotgalibacillus soli]KIL49257.1 epimerase [Jeotgalibacillus soli]
MTIRKIDFLEETAYEIENEQFKAIILPDQGSNLISLFEKKKGVELLRVPKTKEEYERRRMLYGTPVLFPPNRIEDAEFQFEGRTYSLEMNRAKENVHIHGWVHDEKWAVAEIDSVQNTIVTVFQSSDHPDILKQFPHSFVLEMTVKLMETGVIQTLKVINQSNETMPVGVGYHTTFNFPIEDSRLSLDVDSYWELNERHLPTGEQKTVPYKEKLKSGMKLKGMELDDVYPITENHQAVIKHPTLGLKVTYKAIKGFKHWVIFTASGQEDLLAIEPYSWVTNAPNLSLPEEVTGLNGIMPQDEKTYITEINVETL